MYAAMMEELETRICLDAVAFAGVGYGYMASDWDGYLIDDAVARYDGTVDLDTGYASYDYYISAPGGEQPGPFGRQVIRNFTDLEDGRVTGVYETNAFDPSFGYPVSTAGTMFLESEGYPIGWHVSEWGGPNIYGETEVFQLFVEKPTNATPATLGGTWDLVALYSSDMLNVLAAGTGSVTFSGTSVNGQITFGDGSVGPITESVRTVSADGLVRLASGESLQLGADGRVLLFSLMDSSTVMGIGVCFRRDLSTQMSDLAGTYRVGSLWSQDLAWYYNDTVISAGASVLELAANGEFSIYEISSYDLGGRIPVAFGNWTVQGNRAILSDGIDVIELVPGGGGRTLYMTSAYGTPALSVGVRVNEVADYTLAGRPGSVVRAGSESDGSTLAVSRNADGDLVVFQQEGNGWEALRLRDHTTPVQATGDALIWTDPKDGLTYVAGPSDRGFLLYKRDAGGDWSFRNLSIETGAGDNTPIDTLAYFMTRPSHGQPQVVVAGTNASGRIVALQQNGVGSAGAYQWRYYDISADLASQGMATPQFTELVSYVTSWNQWTLAGVDAYGNIQGVWVNIATFTNWRVDNLSRITEALPIAGQLDVTLTTWGGIRFAGADQNGRLWATWWNPGRGPGNWSQTDLGAQVIGGSPSITGGYLTAWFTPADVISYAGYNSAGDLISVYWQPGDGGVWSTRNLTQSLPNRSSRPAGAVTSHVSQHGTVAVVGLASNRDVVCLWWTPDGADRWELDNLTGVATRR